MASPVTRDELKALIPDPSNTICYSFKQVLLKLPLMLWKIGGWIFDENGALNMAWREEVSLVRPGDYIFSARALTSGGTRILCDGAAVSRTTYATLFDAIGTTYGAGNGSTTFNVPNFSNRFPVGAGDTYAIGSTGGVVSTTLLEEHIPEHTHDLVTLGEMGASGQDKAIDEDFVSSTVNASGALTNVTGAYGQATPTPISNLPPYMAVFVYIKA